MRPTLSLIICLIFVSRLSAWDDLTRYTFSINSSSILDSGTHLEENVVTSLGMADVFFHVAICSMDAGPTGLTITGGTVGSCGIQYRFDEPISLTHADLIKIVQVHSGGKNRLTGIYLSLPGSVRLERRNLLESPFLENQNQYALYEFESSYDHWVYPPKNISSIDILFNVPPSESLVVESISLHTVGERVDLAAEIELGGTRNLTIRTNRAIQSDELVRLEASFDLVRWFEKSSYSTGSGDIVTFDKRFNDAQFYRFQWHRIVEPVAALNADKPRE